MAGKLLAAILGLAWAAQASAQSLPLTIAERIAACEAAEDAEPVRAIALAESVLEELPATASTQRAAALGCRGWSLVMLSRQDEARRDAYAVIAQLQTQPATAERVRLTRRAGSILHRGGDRVGAIELYARAVADAEAQGLEAERIPLLVNLGVLHSEFEEHERALINYEQALGLMARLDDFRYEAPVRFNMGLTLNGQQKYAQAIPHLQRTLELVRSTGMGGPTQELAVSLALAAAQQKLGDNTAAAELITRVRKLEVPLHDSNMRLQLDLLEADQLAEEGDPQAALALLDRIDPQELGDIQEWQWLLHRVDMLEKLGRFDDAVVSLRKALELREGYLRHQNHERLAALEAHLRDREQRLEMERLASVATTQGLQLEASMRQKWMIAIAAGLLLLAGGAVLAILRRMNRRLDRASRTDPLTGLANRRDMAECLGRRVATGAAEAALILLDIDHFKRINDEHGHALGDEVLIAIANRLRDCLPIGGRVARWGGEEFLVLLPDVGIDDVRAFFDRVREAMRVPVNTTIGPIQSSLSSGFCNLPLPGVSASSAWHVSMQLADSALYLAKRAHRDTWVGYWIASVMPDWPPERLGREPNLARSLGVLTPISERTLLPPLSIAS